MGIRRAVTVITTIVTAIVVALAVPVAQLKTYTVEHTCCCPDPARCHCPREKPHHDRDATLRPCHRSDHVMASADPEAFTVPTLAAVDAASSRAERPQARLFAPHTAPPAAPPYGPS